jgi:hypothetical protein
MTLTLPHQSRLRDRTGSRVPGLLLRSLLLIALAIPSLSWGQAIELFTYRDNPVTYAFTSTPNNPFITGADPADLGEVSFEQIGTSRDFIMTYTPDPGVTGVDQFRMVYWTWSGGPRVNYADFTVTISENLLIAHPDYAATTAGQLVAVDALANDISSNGIKMLEAVPAANYGDASFDLETGLLEFRPAIDFSGVAHFNYVICNGEGNCDESTVSVTVAPASPVDETKQVFVKRNETAYILVPDHYELQEGPNLGTYTPRTNENVPLYEAGDAPGVDQIVFAHDGQLLTFEIEVLDLLTNSFAFDDRAFTTTDTEVEIAVKENDTSIGTSCMSLSSQPANGSATLLSGGIVRYVPNPGFVGVDQFTYRSFVNACMGEAEIATVYVFVSNFEPAASVFDMATPKRTPIIIGYNVPVGTYSFSVSDQGELGEAMFLSGQVDTTIYGARIQGTNLLLYVPAEQVDSGLDDFEITYCLLDPSGSGDCLMSKTVKIWMTILNLSAGEGPPCVQDCVWAGDTNADGIVNLADLLPIGWQMGEIGNPRAGAGASEWYGQYAEDWSTLFGGGNGVNIKHVDSDGDSMVSAADTTAIRTYFGRTHRMVPNVAADAPYEFYLEAPLFVDPGDLVEVRVILGTPEAPAEDIHGLVFPLNYSPDALQPESFEIFWTRDNFLAYDSPVLEMDYNDLAGHYEAGYTRTSGRVSSGYGVVGTMNVIVDDLVGFRPDQEELVIPIGGGKGSAMNARGEFVSIPVNPIELRVRLKQEDQVASAELQQEDLKVGPVPTRDFLRVHLNGQQTIEQLTLRNMAGQVILQKTVGSNQDNLDLRGLAPGMYILSVSNEKGLLNRKIEVLGW